MSALIGDAFERAVEREQRPPRWVAVYLAFLLALTVAGVLRVHHALAPKLTALRARQVIASRRLP